MNSKVPLNSGRPSTYYPGSSAERCYGGESQNERLAQRKVMFLEAELYALGTTGFRNATVRLLCK